MTDLPAALLIAASVTILVVVVGGAMVSEHTNVQLPRTLMTGQTDRKPGRWALLIEIPWLGLSLGICCLVLLLMVVHPNSSLPVRVVAAAALVASGAWLAYLGWRIAGRR
jgi:hypothetical protein